MKLTCEQIARDEDLWKDFIDPHAEGKPFEEYTYDERVKICDSIE